MDNITINDVYRYCKEFSEDEMKLISRAYSFAKLSHEGQFRQSGEPYIIHPLNVAFILASLHQDANTICAGLLHDVLEDTDTTYEELEKVFNSDIANLVDGVTKIPDSPDASDRKIIINGLLVEPRIVIVKLADRLHNMRTLEYKSKEKQRQKAIETMEFFTPLAYLTGVYNLKMDLEDLAFKYIDPENYKRIEEKRKKFEFESQEHVEQLLSEIPNLLSDSNIELSQLVFKTKNIYRIYRSLEAHDTDSLYDIPSMLSLKIILKNVSDCYAALGAVHNAYPPINAKFKDFICNPRVNGYQSIHTTLKGPDDRLIQAHIRTEEMDKIADYGIFTMNRNSMISEIAKKEFYKQLLEFNELYSDNQEFLSTVKNECFSEYVKVKTTIGEEKILPKGSTIVDFAYMIHSDVGNEMVHAIVNKRVVDFDYILKEGDSVRIVTDKNLAEPQEEWIDYAKTSRAREALKKYFKNRKEIDKVLSIGTL